MPAKEPIAEQFYAQVSESIKLVFDLTSRIDERVKMLVERMNDVENRLDKLLDGQQELRHRVTMLEAKDISEVVEKLEDKLQIVELKIEVLQSKEQGHAKKWAIAFEFIFRLSFILLGGWLLWKFGLQSPPTP